MRVVRAMIAGDRALTIFIESGERVRVAEVQGNRVVVVRVTDENETPG